MPDVKTQIRALEVFQVFAAALRPLRLSELAAEMGIPVSSCFAIVRALLEDGYLYEINPRRGYYPTGRMQEYTRAIGSQDPIVELIGGMLNQLRNQTGETITLGKRTGSQFVYVAGFESSSMVRQTVLAGTVRPLHTNAMGKALLGSMDKRSRQELLARMHFERLTRKTIVSPARLEAEVQKMARRGWYSSDSESTEGALAVSVPLSLGRAIYALQVAGPADRMKSRLASHIRMLLAARQQIEKKMQPGRGQLQPPRGSARMEPVSKRV